MISPNTLIGAPILLGFFWLATEPFALDEPKPVFMEVHEVKYADGMVTATRTVHGTVLPPTGNSGVTVGSDVIADFDVKISDRNALGPAICSTQRGPEQYQGWAVYERAPQSVSIMSIDDWVYDPGCLERLKQKPGEYYMVETWSPRDESRIVSNKSIITIEVDD